MITSEPRRASTPARPSATLIPYLPHTCAGKAAHTPLNPPTAARVALTITTSSLMTGSFRAVWGYYDAGCPHVFDICHREVTRPRQGAKPRKAAWTACLAIVTGAAASRHKRVAARYETAYFGGKVTLSAVVVRKV